jgi:hypothetical protein
MSATEKLKDFGNNRRRRLSVWDWPAIAGFGCF